MRLSHYPSDTADGSLGAFDAPCPLTAPTGPGSVPFWAGRGRKIRLPWATIGEFLGELIGGFCICLLPFALLFLEFLE
jgi:hypothetical protein